MRVPTFDSVLKYFSDWAKVYGVRVISLFKKFKTTENYYIFSEPRGGSTWLAELLNNIPQTAIFWEPLMPLYNRRIRALSFSYRQFIPSDLEWDEAKKAMNQTMKGMPLNKWTMTGMTPISYYRAESLVVKICRGNALLPWFVEQFDLKRKPIYLLRHPLAVICSQMEQGGWSFQFTDFQIPEQPFQEFYSIHRNFLATLETKEESLLASWCLANKAPLSQKPSKWITIFYENLVYYPEEELKKIFKEWNLPIPENIFNEVRKPSRTVINSDTYLKEKLVSKWRENFNRQELNRYQIILDYFGITVYNTESPFPKP